VKKLIPTLVLVLVCGVFTALLVIAHDLTYKDDTGVITDEIMASLSEIYGDSTNFTTSRVLNEENGIVMEMQNEIGEKAYLMTVNGYNKGGITLVAGLGTDGSVRGISIVSLSETPGLGTKVDDTTFLSQFSGFSAGDIAEEVADESANFPVRWGTAAEIEALKSAETVTADGFTLDAITGATLSSNGVYTAVVKAVTEFENAENTAENVKGGVSE
jgi:electron transport complex protein RnfG